MRDPEPEQWQLGLILIQASTRVPVPHNTATHLRKFIIGALHAGAADHDGRAYCYRRA
jgi:hypothetical protein